ncbi:MAG: hypothetical protein WC378_11020, partial [Opitutaceae bacterium]
MNSHLIPRRAELLQSMDCIATGEEAARVFHAQGIYPVTLAPASACSGIIETFVRWSSWYDWTFDEEQRPWVPVGRIGPALMLGHHSPGTVSLPLPLGCFQPVLLGEEDYERQLRLCAPLIAGAGRSVWDGESLSPPRALFPEKFILPSSERGGLQFLVEYFPHDTRDLKMLLENLAAGGK